jgi:hypothetical protein
MEVCLSMAGSGPTTQRVHGTGSSVAAMERRLFKRRIQFGAFRCPREGLGLGKVSCLGTHVGHSMYTLSHYFLVFFKINGGYQRRKSVVTAILDGSQDSLQAVGIAAGVSGGVFAAVRAFVYFRLEVSSFL